MDPYGWLPYVWRGEDGMEQNVNGLDSLKISIATVNSVPVITEMRAGRKTVGRMASIHAKRFFPQ